MSDYAVRLLTDLLKIYSPSRKEEAISNFLVKEMKALGFRISKDSVGNVIGEIGQGKPVILLCGHMDTIPGQLPVRVKNNKIYGAGAVDAKGPLAAMIIAAAKVAQEPTFQAKVVVASVVEEEATSRGVKNLIREGISADYAIFGEPSGAENITIGYKGNLHIQITLETYTGHSSVPWLYENAIEKAFELWQQIENAYPPVEKQESPFHAVTACLIKLSGGKGDSKIPSKCEMHIDLRVPPQCTSAQVFKEAENVIKQYQATNPKGSVKVAIKDSNEPFEVNKNSPLVRALSYSIRKVQNKPATLLRKTGTGDMNILGRAMNMPIVTYGPGDSHLDHTKDEHILISEYLDGIQVYKETILKLIELHEKAGNQKPPLSPS
ncbi:MAG: M20/M25/M40 family metallo-hydrolase [Candidatus Bathyarchaeota archaeon]|nr:MAG: M20/M25/M40 family metallo-hydrolase [Candidatus Bathyarchaeota archaeon]